jgi:MATE family multidrug resistance protein
MLLMALVLPKGISNCSPSKKDPHFDPLQIGMALGLETLGGRAFGAGQLSELGHATYRCTLLLTAIACVVSLCWLQAETVLIFLGQEKTLAKVAARYMHLLIPSLFANAWTQPLVKFLQSQGVTAPLACCAVVALVFHVPNNW